MKVARVLVDRELGSPLPVRGGVDGVVEAISDVLDRVSEKERPMVGEGFLRHCEDAAMDLFPRTSLTLYSERIELAALEGFGFSAQRVQVFYAPLELPLRRCQSHGVTSP
jgi:hypothetical protein